MTKVRTLAGILGQSTVASTGGGGGLTVYDSAGLLPLTPAPSEGAMAYTVDDTTFHIYDSGAGWGDRQMLHTYTTAELSALGKASGSYSIDDGAGGSTTAYYDATTGYALYATFGTGGTYSNSSTYPAYERNSIKHSELGTYGFARSGTDGTIRYDDGTTSSNHPFGTKTETYSFYGDGNLTANVDMSTWNGPSNVTTLIVKWGMGDPGDAYGTGNLLVVNNTTVNSAVTGLVTDSADFNPNGATPLMRVGETSGSVSGISQIWFKSA